MKKIAFPVRARPLFEAAIEQTSGYYFSVEGLLPDPEIVQYLREQRSRPEAMDDEAYLSRVRAGELRLEAARSIGLDPVAVFRRMKVDGDFAERVRVAELEALEPAEKKLRELALGEGDIRALERLLAAKNTEEYGPREKDRKQTEHIEITHADDPIDDEILQLQAEIRNQQQAQNAEYLPEGEGQ